jgi:septal ring factor EnvC (AmiA/AmiB activator)
LATRSAAVRSQVSGTLRAAAVSEEGRELLARGRFTVPLEAEGFDVFSALPQSSPARSREQAPAKKASDELRKAKARVRELERTVRDAERRAAKLKAEWEEAETDAASARAELAAAQKDVKQAERRAKS